MLHSLNLVSVSFCYINLTCENVYIQITNDYFQQNEYNIDISYANICLLISKSIDRWMHRLAL